MIAAVKLEDFKDHHSRKLPLVLYRKPNTTLVKGLMQQDDEIHYTKTFRETGFVMAPFDNKKEAILISGEPRTIRFPAMPKFDAEFPVATFSDESERDRHIALVENALAEIKETPLKKVVLSRKQILKNPSTDVFGILQKLLSFYTTAFVYLWYHPKVGTWLGATPETLLNLRGSNLTTMALAGTQAVEPGVDPVWGTKEAEEQELVTQEIVNRLSQMDGLSVSRGDRVSHRAGQLLHLLTPITARMKNSSFDLKKIIDALHPTPAVCGFPRELAHDFILDRENYNREFYTGYLGEINQPEKPKVRNTSRNVENRAYQQIHKISALFVNLRCMQLQQDRAVLYVGGGITAQSDPKLEWQETVNKAITMQRVLGAN